MKLIIKVCIGIMLMGILCAMPAAADIPTDIVDQYWVWYPMPAFVVNPTEPGYWVNPINHLGVAHPVWGANQMNLDINNVFKPNNTKNIWIEVKYVLPQTEIANLTIADPLGNIYAPVETWIGSKSLTQPNGSISSQFVTWKFHLPWQPDLETVNFGTTDFYNLRGMELLEVGTLCTSIPEPGSLLALGTGIVGLAGFVIKRRKS
jgi:hypothetical protein